MKKGLIILSLLLCFTLMVTACGGSTDTKQGTIEKSAETTEKSAETAEKAEPETTPAEIEKSEVASGDSKLETIADFADLWTNLFNENERVINEYDGMPIMALVLPGTCFISGVQYDLLNMENKDGRYEGELMFAGYKGFIEKDGSNLTFGYDDVLDKDGFGPSAKAGDRKVETGNCDLENVYFFEESYSERNGSQFLRSTSEFRQEKDGSISCFVLNGNSIDIKGDEAISNEAVFIRNGKDQYDFVVAKAEVGPNFEIIPLKDRKDMTKEKAIQVFQDAGYVLEMSGGIVDGKLTLD